jgi:hypothetical protein
LSPLTYRPPPPALLVRAERPAATRVLAAPRLAEGAVVFAAAFAAYFVLGLYTTLDLHIVIGDAQARLFHAYYPWHNDPGKLAAMGFYWPPVQTLVLVPFGISHSLATSLAALPLTSALFGAGLLATVDRALALTGIDRAIRWLIVAAFGLNPMIVFYSANGMAEMVYLLPLTIAVYLFMRWGLAPRWQDVPMIGIALAVGVVARYEVGVWVPLLLAGIVVVLVQRRARAVEIEAASVAVLAPVVYVLVLWTFVTWTITGDAFQWLTSLFPGPSGSAATAVARPIGAGAGVARTVADQLGLFPPTFLLLPVVLLVAWRRRDVVGLVLGGALVVNLLTSVAIVARAQDESFLELRYNMRAMPIAAIAVGWLLATARPERRRVAAAGAVALVALSVPVTAATMAASTVGSDRAFVRGILHGRPSASGTSTVRDQRALARYTRAHVHARGAILADDGTTFGVMLADGDPNRYFDRIDRGDRVWMRDRDAIAAGRSVAHVRYLLVNRSRRVHDQVVTALPALRANRDLPPFVRPAFVTRHYALYRLVRR